MKPLPLLPSLPSNVENPIQLLASDLGWHPESRVRAQQLFERGLPPLGSVDTLPRIFGVSPALIHSMRVNPEQYYRTFEIPKAHGFRRIDAPRVALKVLQRWIHDHILTREEPSPASHAFISGRGIFSNCSAHLNRKNMMSLDISEFFQSVTHIKTVRVFDSIGFAFPVSLQLADLCTLNDGLPQGSPASPMIANLTMVGIDTVLDGFAQSLGGSYTRYADDLTFSSDSHVFTEADVARVSDWLTDEGFRLNTRKTRRVGGGFRHEVTGLSATEKSLPPRRLRRMWRKEFHVARKFGLGSRARLEGIAGFVHQYDRALANSYAEIARQLPSQG
ncbi:MAG: reverse transcriptase domain-containing protein [Dehalococcoidia bacterium]